MSKRLAAIAILLLGALLFLYSRRAGAPRAPSEADLVNGPSALGAGPPRPAPGAPSSAEQPAAERAPDALWEERLARAQRTLDTYLASTRYPPTSRPISEQPDRVRPHFVSGETIRPRRRDDKLTDARVTLRQDRHYMVGDERVALSLTCANSNGPTPCEVLSTLVRGEGQGAPGAGVTVPFRAGELGAESASFQPSAQGFAGYSGPIRIFVDLRVDGEEGQVSFEVMYTAAAPAIFTGAIREALADGSLDLHVEIEVEKPGRYVIEARVDDAEGRSFAYLSFNEVLGRGRQEARLRLFGKLVIDQEASSPFRLRDIEGFLLKEDTYPDRELMPALEGVVHTTKRYAGRDFADRVWESEEKDRHVEEFKKDVETAKRHVGGGE